MQMRENRKLIQRYNDEQETFSNNMENKIKTMCQNVVVKKNQSIGGQK